MWAYWYITNSLLEQVIYWLVVSHYAVDSIQGGFARVCECAERAGFCQCCQHGWWRISNQHSEWNTHQLSFWLLVCVCLEICAFVCDCVCVCAHMCMYVCACLLCVCLWECACVCMHMYACICVLAYSVFVSCVYVCTCVLCNMYTVICVLCVLIPTLRGGSDSPSDNTFQSQQHLELCQTSVHCPLCARGWVLTTASLLSPWSVCVRALSVPLTMEWRVLWLTHLSWKLQWPRSVPWRWDSVKMALN